MADTTIPKPRVDLPRHYAAVCSYLYWNLATLLPDSKPLVANFLTETNACLADEDQVTAPFDEITNSFLGGDLEPRQVTLAGFCEYWKTTIEPKLPDDNYGKHVSRQFSFVLMYFGAVHKLRSIEYACRSMDPMTPSATTSGTQEAATVFAADIADKMANLMLGGNEVAKRAKTSSVSAVAESAGVFAKKHLAQVHTETAQLLALSDIAHSTKPLDSQEHDMRLDYLALVGITITTPGKSNDDTKFLNGCECSALYAVLCLCAIPSQHDMELKDPVLLRLLLERLKAAKTCLRLIECYLSPTATQTLPDTEAMVNRIDQFTVVNLIYYTSLYNVRPDGAHSGLQVANREVLYSIENNTAQQYLPIYRRLLKYLQNEIKEKINVPSQ